MLKHVPFYASLCGRTLFKDTVADNSHVLVYGAIEAHSMGEYGCIASNERIAEETNLSLATVKKAVSQLKAAGWIDTHNDKSSNTRNIIPNMDLKLVSREKPSKVVSQEKPARFSGETPINIDTGLDTKKEIDKSISKIGESKGEMVGYSAKDVELSNLLRSELSTKFQYLKTRPANKGNLRSMHMLHEKDGYDYETIEAVIKWAAQDDFWSGVIQSETGLRRNFNKLLVSAQRWMKEKKRSQVKSYE